MVDDPGLAPVELDVDQPTTLDDLEASELAAMAGDLRLEVADAASKPELIAVIEAHHLDIAAQAAAGMAEDRLNSAARGRLDGRHEPSDAVA